MDDSDASTVVTGGVLTADAAGGDHDRFISVTSADISTSAAGAIDLDETDAITLTVDADTNDGSITVDDLAERLQRRMW